MVVGFLGGLITQTMTFIVADLGGTLTDQTNVLSLTRIGALATIGVSLLGDRHGRRPLIAIGLLGAAMASLEPLLRPRWRGWRSPRRPAVASSPAPVCSSPSSCWRRCPPRRAYATGLLAMSAGLGVGIVLWVLKLADLSRGSWRLIYLLSILFAALTVHAVRRLPESHRFAPIELRSSADGRNRISTRRLLILGLVFVLLNIFVGPAQQLQNEYLRTVRHFSGGKITAFLLLTNTWGGIGIIVGVGPPTVGVDISSPRSAWLDWPSPTPPCSPGADGRCGRGRWWDRSSGPPPLRHSASSDPSCSRPLVVAPVRVS